MNEPKKTTIGWAPEPPVDPNSQLPAYLQQPYQHPQYPQQPHYQQEPQYQQPPLPPDVPLKSMPDRTGRFFGGLMMTVPSVVSELREPVMALLMSYASPIVVLSSQSLRFVGFCWLTVGPIQKSM